MDSFALNYESIVANLHPLPPRPSQSLLRGLCCQIDPVGQRFFRIDLSLELGAGQLMAIRFNDVWSNALPGELRLPDLLGRGVLIVDVRKWGWECPIVVVADDEDYHTMFGARTVENISVNPAT